MITHFGYSTKSGFNVGKVDIRRTVKGQFQWSWQLMTMGWSRIATKGTRSVEFMLHFGDNLTEFIDGFMSLCTERKWGMIDDF